MKKIYTKAGDSGRTFDGKDKVYKSYKLIHLQGEIDELNAHLGLVSEIYQHPSLKKIQKDLLEMGAQLAIEEMRLKPEDIEFIESVIDEMNDSLPELKNFIVPNQCSEIHIARAVCRRVERTAVDYKYQITNTTKWQYLENVLPYLNRLSDYLFVMARYYTVKAEIWDGKSSKTDG